MRSTARVCALMLLLSVVAAVPHRGGSMVLTLEELPEYLVVGEPFTFRFVGREHTRIVPADNGAMVMVNGKRVDAERTGNAYTATWVPAGRSLRPRLRTNAAGTCLSGRAVSPATAMMPSGLPPSAAPPPT